MTAYNARFSEIEQGLAYHAGRTAEAMKRIRAEIAFANRLAAAHPEHAADWRERILQAGHMVDERLQQNAPDITALTAEAEALLAPLGETAKSYTLLCVGHAHIDMNWQWSWPETVALTHDTFETMLALMDEFPGFIFSQSQASVYAAMEKYDPPMFEQIRKRVAEGRWEVTASQWVEGDTNLAAGESISRHLLYTRAYFQEKFGLSPEDVTIAFEPDTFGHPATLPTILARGGVRHYYHCRGSRGPHVYWWVGPDGSRILTFNDIQWYMHFDATRGHVAIDTNMADPVVEYAQSTGLYVMPVLYGVGDHGGGPTRKDLRKIIEMDTWPIYPRVEFSTLRRFFDLAEQAENLPVIKGERNFVFEGCYTSQARQKEANRHNESLMIVAETAAVLGERLAGVTYPQQNLVEAWRALLFDQFHDILPGSGMRVTRDYTLGHAQDVQATAGMARTNALRALGRRIDTDALHRDFATGGALRAIKDEVESGIALGAGVGNASGTGGESGFSAARTSDRVYLVFNPLAHPRSEVIRVKLWDTALDPALLVATNAGAAPQTAEPVQVIGKGNYAGHDYLEVAFPVEVPALGYRTVCISDRRIELGLPVPAEASLWDGVGGALRTREPAVAILENEFLAVRLDPASGSIVSLVDKRTKREYVRPGEHLGMLQYCVEAYEGMSAWVIGQFKSREDLLQGGQLTKVDNGPYVQTYRWHRKLGDTTLALDISLSRGTRRIDFELHVDWREVGSREGGIPHLKVRFPANLVVGSSTPVARYEIPFGSIERELFNGEEVPAQRWVDLFGEDGVGITLVNTSKYGFNVEGTSLNMTLLRASIDPDPLPDLGDHVIRYALVPHAAGWSDGDSTQAGEGLNVPLVISSVGFHAGDLPPVASLVSVEPKGMRLVALKRAEDGNGMILRLVEVEGVPAEAQVHISAKLLGGNATVAEVDTLERPAAENTARLQDGTLTVHIPAFGVASVRVTA